MRSATVAELASSPVDRYVAGRTFVHGCVAESLWAVTLWDRPNEQDAASLVRSLQVELAPHITVHGSVVDASRVQGVDARAFEIIASYVAQEKAALAQKVSRLALVRPAGMEGAVVAGFFSVQAPPYPVETFVDLAGALAWLHEHDLSPAWEPEPTGAAIDAIIESARGHAPVVTALRTLLDGERDAPTLAEAAKALGMSERTLQRRLSDAGFSFQEEVVEARIRRAKRLMLDTDAPLTSIALDVGCASLQHFSALFRRRTGQSPSAWRKARGGLTEG